MQPHTVKRFSLSNLSYGAIAYLVSLLGTLLLPSELNRFWGVLLLIGAAVLAVFAWRRQKWTPAFPEHSVTRIPSLLRSRLYLLGMLTAVLLVLAAALRYLAAPNETFGVAGTLWLAGIAVLLCSVFVGSWAADRARGANSHAVEPLRGSRVHWIGSGRVVYPGLGSHQLSR